MDNFEGIVVTKNDAVLDESRITSGTHLYNYHSVIHFLVILPYFSLCEEVTAQRQRCSESASLSHSYASKTSFIDSH